MNKQKVWVDGGGRTKIAPARIAVVYYEGGLLKDTKKEVGSVSSNEAEFLAVIEALKMEMDNYTMYSDCDFVVRAMNGEIDIYVPILVPHWMKARRLAHKKNITFKWVPRGKNRAGILLDDEKLNNKMQRAKVKRKRLRKPKKKRMCSKCKKGSMKAYKTVTFGKAGNRRTVYKCQKCGKTKF